MATLDSRAESAFMQAWPLVADWIIAHREAISEYVRRRERYLMEVCFEALWRESAGSTHSSLSDQFSEPEGVRVDNWYNWLHRQGDQSRRAHDVCVYKLNQVCSHICGSLGAGSYMRHSRLNMPVEKVVVLELIVILLRAQSWEPI
jgi:hypothetical protein